ncbi:MAG: CBS domain-containing protein [Candidatus Hydrothermarchaeales archaeon]
MTTVKSIMHSATIIDPDTTVFEVAKMMRDKSIGSVLLNLGESNYGIVTERDMVFTVTAGNMDAKVVKARDVMTKLQYTVDSNASLAEATEIFNEHHIRRLPVMEGGEIIGVVTSRDVAKASASARA